MSAGMKKKFSSATYWGREKCGKGHKVGGFRGCNNTFLPVGMCKPAAVYLGEVYEECKSGAGGDWIGTTCPVVREWVPGGVEEGKEFKDKAEHQS